MKMAYLCYPYSDDPKRRTEEVKALAEKIIERHPEIILIVPHVAFDGLIEKFIAERTWWKFIGEWELETISRCDIFIVGLPIDPKVSMGCYWEWTFAKRLGKEIVDAGELLK